MEGQKDHSRLLTCTTTGGYEPNTTVKDETAAAGRLAAAGDCVGAARALYSGTITLIPLVFLAAMAGTAQDRPIALSAVRVTAGPAGPVVSIAADGPLPAPTVGVLDSPDRIYLDLRGVTAAASRTAAAGDVIASVRVALHSAAPPVTRVVIDLVRPVGHSVDLSRRLSGTIEVSLHAAAETRSLPPPVPSVRIPAPSSSPSAGPQIASQRLGAGVRQYVIRMTPFLQRLEALRPVLESIDTRSPVSVARVDAAAVEIERLRADFASMRPPGTLLVAHDLLRNACGLASTALSLARMSKDGVVPSEAASAAAGALILLTRARAELPDSTGARRPE
jgi:hypothetical protein